MAKILLNKSNFFHNLDICSQQTKSKNKIAIVLKDNAYGHGLIEIAQMAYEYGITKAVVRTVAEAQKVASFFDYILILADTNSGSLAHHFHITINSLEDLSKIGACSNIAIKIDTGMHRNGILPNQLEACIYGSCKHKLNITSIFTHYRNADVLSSEYFWQKHHFKALKAKAKKICAKLKLPKIAVHSSNSSALFRDNNFDEDFARIGLAAYGYLENEYPLPNPNLKPIMSLIANKISTRVLKQNCSVGYGATFTANKDINISTYDIGYADGFRRLATNKIFYTQDGSQLLGRISMDNISIASGKDEICLFDDVTNLANLHNTINYEILTSLSSNIKREIV